MARNSASTQIVPAILATNIEQYNRLFNQLSHISGRLSLDLTDGIFAKTRTINLIQAHWLPDKQIDIHLMFKDPLTQLETLISRQPNLVVVHAEAKGKLANLINQLQAVGIKAGIALLPDTTPQAVGDLLAISDHALIFSGNLGTYGGNFNPQLLAKAEQIRQIKPKIEIAWDGGVNDQNLVQIARAGIDVVNVGGFIARAADPAAAYRQLTSVAAGVRT